MSEHSSSSGVILPSDPEVIFPDLDALPTTDFEISLETVGDNSQLRDAHADIPISKPMGSLGLTQADRLEMRRVILRAAYMGVTYHNRMTYSEGALRWSGIADRILDYGGHVPPYADCSSFLAWLFWDPAWNWLRLGDFLNGCNWKAGYTATMVQHGVSVSLENMQTCDAVFYGEWDIPYHTTLYVGNGRVISMGRPGAPELVPIGPATQARRYIY